MSIVLMPYDIKSKDLAKIIQRMSKQEIYITDGLSNVKSTLEQLEKIEFDYAIGLRQDLGKNDKNGFLKIICSAKKEVCPEALKLGKALKSFTANQNIFYYLSNRFNSYLNVKNLTDKDEILNSWFSEIQYGEKNKKDIFIISLGTKNKEVSIEEIAELIVKELDKTPIDSTVSIKAAPAPLKVINNAKPIQIKEEQEKKEENKDEQFSLNL